MKWWICRKAQLFPPLNGDFLQEPYKFEVPDGDRSLLFGSFDNLIRLTDPGGGQEWQAVSEGHMMIA